jgi:hypothetical protein
MKAIAGLLQLLAQLTDPAAALPCYVTVDTFAGVTRSEP